MEDPLGVPKYFNMFWQSESKLYDSSVDITDANQ